MYIYIEGFEINCLKSCLKKKKEEEKKGEFI
jgi:hypothetical protein